MTLFVAIRGTGLYSERDTETPGRVKVLKHAWV